MLCRFIDQGKYKEMEAMNEAEEIVHPMDMRSMMIIKALVLKNMIEISNTSY